MRCFVTPLIGCTLMLCLAGCSAHKFVQRNIAIATDSLARKVEHQRMELRDSLFSSLHFEFDTLDITIERKEAQVPEVIRIRAVKGQVASNRNSVHHEENRCDKIDTLALSSTLDTSETQEIDRVTAYTPPNGNWVVVVVVGAIIFIGMLVLWYLHKRFFRL